MKTWNEKDVQIQAITECGDAYLTEVIAFICTFQKYNERKKDYVACNPPDWIARTLKQRASLLRLPTLNGVTNCPVIRTNGELVNVPGHHKETGIFFDPRGVEFPAVMDRPSKDDAQRALDRLKVLFHTFAFVDEASRGVALSLLLTAVARRALDTAPMHAFDAPTAGSGKSMITDIVSIIATGERAGVIGHTENQQEFDKLLSAVLMSGFPLIAIDNCEGQLKGVLLCQTLTQEVVNCRILGKSEYVPIRSNATISANGNNLVMVGDLTRRTIYGRLDTGVERPELLEYDYSPLADAKENRPELVGCALTVLRAYHVAGRPDRPLPLNGFEQWSNWVRAALIWLGEVDPVVSMEKIRDKDPRLNALHAIVELWWVEYGAKPMTASEMIRRAEDEHLNCVDEWYEAVRSVAGVGRAIDGRRLGNWLSSVVDRPVAVVVGDERLVLRIERGKLRSGNTTWIVVEWKKP